MPKPSPPRLGYHTDRQIKRMAARAGKVDWIAKAAILYGQSAAVDDAGALARAWVTDNVDLFVGDHIARNQAEKTARRCISRLIGRPELAGSPPGSKAMLDNPTSIYGWTAIAALIALLMSFLTPWIKRASDNRKVDLPPENTEQELLVREYAALEALEQRAQRLCNAAMKEGCQKIRATFMVDERPALVAAARSLASQIETESEPDCEGE